MNDRSTALAAILLCMIISLIAIVPAVGAAGDGPAPVLCGFDAPNDPDSDGLYEDVDGRLGFNQLDVEVLFRLLDDSSVSEYSTYYKFSGTASGVSVFDVQALYNEPKEPVRGDGPPPVNCGYSEPNDPDGDGLYEDVDGDGEFDIIDIQVLFQNTEDLQVAVYDRYYNFSGAGDYEVTESDVRALYSELASGGDRDD